MSSLYILEVQRATRAIARLPSQMYLCLSLSLSLTRRHDTIQRNVSISLYRGIYAEREQRIMEINLQLICKIWKIIRKSFIDVY